LVAPPKPWFRNRGEKRRSYLSRPPCRRMRGAGRGRDASRAFGRVARAENNNPGATARPHFRRFDKFGLCYAERCLRSLRAQDCCHIGTGGAITTEFSAAIKYRLAAGLHVHWSAAATRRATYEVTKRLMGFNGCPEQAATFPAPFQRRERDPSTSSLSVALGLNHMHSGSIA
jgi:hypothetical protein